MVYFQVCCWLEQVGWYILQTPVSRSLSRFYFFIAWLWIACMNVQCWVFSCRGLSWRMRMVVYSLISPYWQCFALFLLALWPMFLIPFLLGFFHSSETVRALYLVVGSFSLPTVFPVVLLFRGHIFISRLWICFILFFILRVDHNGIGSGE